MCSYDVSNFQKVELLMEKVEKNRGMLEIAFTIFNFKRKQFIIFVLKFVSNIFLYTEGMRIKGIKKRIPLPGFEPGSPG